MAGTIDLNSLFGNLQTQMIAQLTANRKIISHPGTKGDATEYCWIDMLQKYLPQRYSVAKAFVLDCEGKLSDQIDIVIFDRQYSPFLFNQNSALYVPAESVYAAIEVKQDINKKSITYAGKKIASIRRLKRTSTSIAHAGGKYPAKPHFEILGGILALGCGWNPPFSNGFEGTINGLKLDQKIQLGCSLCYGSFNITREDNDEYNIELCEAENSLIFFFLRLLARLQQMATVPAIDIDEYAKALKK
jgi:hypothetical protein